MSCFSSLSFLSEEFKIFSNFSGLSSFCFILLVFSFNNLIFSFSFSLSLSFILFISLNFSLFLEGDCFSSSTLFLFLSKKLSLSFLPSFLSSFLLFFALFDKFELISSLLLSFLASNNFFIDYYLYQKDY